MRRESHRRRGAYRASSGGWGHRAVYIGAVVATVAIVTGFGSAVLIYGPIGTGYRQLSGSTIPIPPVGVQFGNAQEIIASSLPAYNTTTPNVFGIGGYSNASSLCNASGVFSPDLASVFPSETYPGLNLNFNLTWGNVTSGNETFVCLNSVGANYYANPTAPEWAGLVNSTWYAGLFGTTYLTDLQGQTYVPNNQSWTNGAQTIQSCNNFTAPASAPVWASPWNMTHINNMSFTPCNTFYQMNNNTTVLPSFDGVNYFNGVGWSGTPDNSTNWVLNESGYMGADDVYEIPVIFENTSTNGIYEICLSITGITPLEQCFNFNVTVTATGANASVVFLFDMTAAWLYDTSYSYNGVGAVTSTTTHPEIYGAVGLSTLTVTQCSSDGVCPVV